VTPKGNRIQPHRTRRAFTWAVDVTTRSYITARESAHAISRALEPNFHRHHASDLHETRELKEAKPKSYSRPRDLSRHIILATNSLVDMKNLYRVHQNTPPPHPVQTKQKTAKPPEQMHRTMKQEQKSCGRGNIRWWLATKTRQDQDRSALRRPTSSGWDQGRHRRHPRRGCCYRSSRFQYPVVAGQRR
jgi:hypothetical protein